jgi:hypothetical protein
MTTEPTLPPPTYFGRVRHWKLSQLLEYEAALAGTPDKQVINPVDERFLSAAQVRERYGVSDMWIWRRLNEKSEGDDAQAA